MGFKLFGKKEEPTMVPATPKNKLATSFASFRSPVTPSLMDASIRGDQKRTAVLESQLKEISMTASKAYDELDQVKTENSQLQAQLLEQQKNINTLTKQLQQAQQEKEQFKLIQDREIKQKLQQRTQESNQMQQLQQEKQQMAEKLALLEKKMASASNLQQPSFYVDTDRTNTIIVQHEREIETLKAKITDLTHLLEAKDLQYEESMSIFNNTISILKKNKSFLNQPGYNLSNQVANTSIDESYNESTEEIKQNTYVLSNLSFIP